MTSERRLVGFSEELDWRPMNFMYLNSLRACSLCNVVPKVTHVLECSHALCEMCYQNVLQNRRQCPLDGEDFEESQTARLVLTPREVSKQIVRCCNFKERCDFVGPVEQINAHFFNECTFHAAMCNRCKVKVLRKGIVNHYMEQCQSRGLPPDKSTTDVVSAALEMGKKLETSLGIMADRLCAIEDQLNSHVANICNTKDCVASNSDVLSKLIERQEQLTDREDLKSVNDNLRALTQRIGDLAACMDVSKDVKQAAEIVASGDPENDHTDETAAAAEQHTHGEGVFNDHDATKEDGDIPKAVLETDKRLSSIEEILGELQTITRLQNNVFYYNIQDFMSIDKEALSKGEAVRFSDTFVALGYSARLSVEIKNYCGTMSFGVFLSICQSSKDSLLKWPFTYPHTLMLIHPTDYKKSIELRTDGLERIGMNRMCFTRPATLSNRRFGLRHLCFLQDVFEQGFVYEGSVTVGVKFL